MNNDTVTRKNIEDNKNLSLEEPGEEGSNVEPLDEIDICSGLFF